MTTAYTSLLGLALPVTGELSGTWGDTVNTAITSLLDSAVAGTTSITVDADITLTTTTGASNEARQAIILWNPASGTTTRNITAPAQSKLYTVINASGGTQSIVIRGAGPTTGVTIAKGESAQVAWNGSDFVKVGSSGGAATFTNLTVTGNTILGDAAADTLTVNATSTFAAPVSFQGLVNLPSTGRSAAAALTPTNPAFLYGVASTYTDTTSSGTLAPVATFYSLARPTLATSNVTTYTTAATLYIANSPAAGGSATITNPFALYVAAGANYFAGTSTFVVDAVINGLTVGEGGGSIATNTAVGASALAANTTGTANTAIGAQAGRDITSGVNLTAVGYQAARVTTGNNTTAIGTQALLSNTTGTNTAVGFSALYVNTTGTDSVAIGASALVANTTGSTNVAVGHAALGSNTTASNNTAIGFQAGYTNATGTLVTAVGYQAAFSSTAGFTVAVGHQAARATSTGVSNTAIGNSALATNTTGSQSTAVGEAALGSSTTASDNTAVGYLSLYSSTTATNNTAVGVQAGRYLNGSYNDAFGHLAMRGATGGATGTENSAFGRLSLYQLTSGSYNVAAGGSSLQANTSGSTNTALGWAALQANTTASNNTAIGYQAAYNNTTGTRTTAGGAYALFSNTTGVNNVGFGAYALFTNVTGTRNAGFGDQAGYYQTGNDNTAVGFGALIGVSGQSNANANTSVGSYSGYSVTTGAANAVLGAYALYSNTTGNYNIAIGYEALYTNASGYLSTAIGYSAGRASTTNGVTYIGGFVGRVATGSGNTGVGGGDTNSILPTFYNLTSGSVNTAVGGGALGGLTTGDYNNAFGYTALYNTTTGGSNVAMGWQAGFSTTTGGSNTFIGDRSGYATTTASNNTFVGHYSGYGTTGGSNTFIGVNAGYLVTTGTKNTILGWFNGNQGNLDIRTSNNNIVLSDGDGNPRFYFYNANWYTNAPGACGIVMGIDTNNTAVSNRLFFQNASNAMAITGAAENNGTFYFQTGSTPNASSGTLRLSANENGIGLGGTVPTSGTGVKFPATQSSSSDANTLDDYEEGTWTPTFASDGGTTGTTNVTQRWGRYVKIGREVTVTFGWSGSLSGYSGTLYVGNMPFSVVLDTTYQYGGNFTCTGTGGTSGGGVNYVFMGFSNALYPWWTDGQSNGYLFVGSTQINGLTSMIGTMTYFTAG